MFRTSHLSATTQGIIAMIASVTLFSLMDAIAKRLGQDFHVVQILFARFAGQLVILMMVLRTHVPRLTRTRHRSVHIVRALLQLSAAGSFFLALKSVGLAQATAVADLAPVLITLGAALWLRESVGPRRIAGIIAALIGALIVIRPGLGVFTPASTLPLITALSLALYALLTRRIGLSEQPVTALIWSGLVGTIALGIVLPAVWIHPNTAQLLLMIALAGIGMSAQFLTIRAYSIAEASVVAPFSYAGLIAATLWGLVFFADLPDGWTMLGGLVIVGAGLYVWHRERKSGGPVHVPPQDLGQP